MRSIKLFSAAFLSICLYSLQAQAPSAPELLPEDTIGLITIPDFEKLSRASEKAPFGRFWNDPSMNAFREKLMNKLQAEVVAPLEKELGVNLGDYKDLLQGQVSIALMPPGEESAEFFSFLFLLDAGEKSQALSEELAELRRKWRESGKETRTEQIRGTEFTRVSFTGAEVEEFLKRAFPGEEAGEEEEDSEEPEKATELYIGQSKSLLIAGEDPEAIQKVLARQAGGEVRGLSEKTGFQKTSNSLFREAITYGWLNFEPIYQRIMKMAAAEQEAPAGMGFSVEQALPALGLAGLKEIAFSLSAGADGTLVEAFIGVPEAERAGIFKVFSIEPKPAGPPPFVPADAVQFQRIRIDAQKAWAAIEAMLNGISPQMGGMIQMLIGMVEQLGQQQDPSFTFKGNFISNLGDDFITYQKAPRSSELEALLDPPVLVLIGSPNPGGLAEAIRFVSMLGPVAGDMKEREFLGRKIYSITMGVPQIQPEGEDAPEPAVIPATQTLSFAAGGEYVALSTDAAILEEYLRAGEDQGRSLREFPGLAEAAQKAGGMEGMFTFENQKETYGVLWETVKEDPEAFTRTIFFGLSGGQNGESGLKDWIDFSLLPPWNQVSKYFGIAVMTGTEDADGILFRAWGPAPPELR